MHVGRNNHFWRCAVYEELLLCVLYGQKTKLYKNRGYLDRWGILRWPEKFSDINVADYLLWKLMAGSSIASSVSFTSSVGVSKAAKVVSMRRYFSEISMLPLGILLPYVWGTGTYMFSLVNYWPREGSWVMDEEFRDQKGGRKSELNSHECWPRNSDSSLLSSK